MMHIEICYAIILLLLRLLPSPLFHELRGFAKTYDDADICARLVER
jgi:hypothetical protein